MKFSIIFYKDKSGKKPVLDFLNDLQKKNSNLHAALVEGINRLKDKSNHKRPLSAPLGGKLFELRINIGRVIYCFDKGRKIILLHAFAKKTKKISKKDIKLARKRMKDYMSKSGRQK